MIDKEKLKTDLCCDDDFLRMLIDQFNSDSEETIVKLQNAIKDQNWAIVKGSSHKILSSTYIFDLTELSAIFKKMEDYAGNQKNLEELPLLLQQAEKELEKVKVELGTF